MDSQDALNARSALQELYDLGFQPRWDGSTLRCANPSLIPLPLRSRLSTLKPHIISLFSATMPNCSICNSPGFAFSPTGSPRCEIHEFTP